jgi:hypothetical protein
MMKVTRNVVTDLWPIYESGEASPDTRALVDDFLANDQEFARRLREQPPPLPGAAVSVVPDGEATALRRTRDLVHGHSWLRGLRLMALVLTIFSISRLFSDATWIVSPRVFIADALLATTCWTAYGLLLHGYRKRSLQ